MLTTTKRRHDNVITLYERTLRKLHESFKKLPDSTKAYVPVMDVYTQIAEETGYSVKHVGDIVRRYLKGQDQETNS